MAFLTVNAGGLAAVVDEDITEVGLSDYPGKYVILFWYPKDFTYVCPSGAPCCLAPHIARRSLVCTREAPVLLLVSPWALRMSGSRVV